MALKVALSNETFGDNFVSIAKYAHTDRERETNQFLPIDYILCTDNHLGEASHF